MGVCTFSVTRSTVHTEAVSTTQNMTNPCISESHLVYCLKIPPAKNYALHCNSSVARCCVLIHRTYFCDLSTVSWSINITALITPKQHSSSVHTYTLTAPTARHLVKLVFKRDFPVSFGTKYTCKSNHSFSQHMLIMTTELASI